MRRNLERLATYFGRKCELEHGAGRCVELSATNCAKRHAFSFADSQPVKIADKALEYDYDSGETVAS